MADGAEINWTERLLTIIERQGAMQADIAGLHRADAEQRGDIKELLAKFDALSVTITTQNNGLRADLLTHIDKALATREQEPPPGLHLSARELVLIIGSVALAAVILTYVAVTQMGVRHIPGVQ